MNAATRKARQILRDRTRSNRAATRINRRGEGSLTTHAIAQGLTARDARSLVGTLRKEINKLGITGTEHRVHAGRQMRTTHRYTPAEVALAAANYKPRKPAYRIVAAQLRLAA